ncbi:hypothetical protein NDU88_001093 [Pleurodeles waltl]|uniref:Retrotransposon gag domain-containing protein n=1 Tax=Pleurodeles waltl TaxID=8319 RepID=A0AAV7SZB1_PLEWA|nr:hypothetical protein NDU88_001093 [Pleurodeles waltl]
MTRTALLCPLASVCTYTHGHWSNKGPCGEEGERALGGPRAPALDNHFLPKVSIILQRYYFGKRKQMDDESIEDFVTALRKLASSCNFGENLEERIRDRFMLECKCDKVFMIVPDNAPFIISWRRVNCYEVFILKEVADFIIMKYGTLLTV